MAGASWPADGAWAAIDPLPPETQAGVQRAGDRNPRPDRWLRTDRGLLADAGPHRTKRLIADKGCDVKSLRHALAASDTEAVTPSARSREAPIPHYATADREGIRIERDFGALKDWRHIAIRYDRLARNFLSAVAIAAAIIWWT